MIKWFKCFFNLCSFISKSDETGCWGECIECGQKVGYVTRTQLREYAERQLNERKRTA